MARTFLTLLAAACAGLAASTPISSSTAALRTADAVNPRRLTVETSVVREGQFKVVLRYRLPGGPDSVLTRLTRTSPPLELTHRLRATVTRDSFLLDRPAVLTVVNGIACVQSKRRALLSMEVCAPWSYTEADAPPPPPVLDSVIPDTMALRIARLDVKPDNLTLVMNTSACLCAFPIFGDGQVAMAADDADDCATYYQHWPDSLRRPRPAQQAIADTLTVLWQATGGTMQPGACGTAES